MDSALVVLGEWLSYRGGRSHEVSKELQKKLKHCQLLCIHNTLIAFFLSSTELDKISNGNEKAKNVT